MKQRRNTSRKSDKKAQKRAVVLESILANVPFDGWTEAALDAGAKDAGIDAKDMVLLFPKGVSDVVAAWCADVDSAMLAKIEAERGFARMRVRDKVAFAVQARFEALQPHREAVKRLMVWGIMPVHLVQMTRHLAHTADIIWQAAGDNSTDYNFYTKRLLLGAVIKTTTFYWLNDETSGSVATWGFLERRLAEVVRAGKAISLAREWTPTEVLDMLKNKFAN